MSTQLFIRTVPLHTISILCWVSLALSACDSSTSNQAANQQLTANDKSQNTVKVDTHISDAISKMAATNDKANEALAADNKNNVGPNGYQGLKFGQIVTPELIEELGLVPPDLSLASSGCYFTYPKNMTEIDSTGQPDSPVRYQIIDGKLALIKITGMSIPFYTGLKVGDSPAQALDAHQDDLHYEVDKYAENGNLYSLLHNINFTIINEPELGALIDNKTLKIEGNYGDIPLQIEYHFKNGQDLGVYAIKPNEWHKDNKAKLTGELESIDIGTTEAIYLVEGCS